MLVRGQWWECEEIWLFELKAHTNLFPKGKEKILNFIIYYILSTCKSHFWIPMCSYFSCYLTQSRWRYWQDSKVKTTIHSFFAIYFEPNTCHTMERMSKGKNVERGDICVALYLQRRQNSWDGASEGQLLHNSPRLTTKKVLQRSSNWFSFFTISLLQNPSCCLFSLLPLS